MQKYLDIILRLIYIKNFAFFPESEKIPVREWRCSAGVAQLVEQLTCNQQVAGSSPIASSIIKVNSSSGGIPEWPKGTDCKSVVGRLRRFESSSLHHKITTESVVLHGLSGDLGRMDWGEAAG